MAKTRGKTEPLLECHPLGGGGTFRTTKTPTSAGALWVRTFRATLWVLRKRGLLARAFAFLALLKTFVESATDGARQQGDGIVTGHLARVHCVKNFANFGYVVIGHK